MNIYSVVSDLNKKTVNFAAFKDRFYSIFAMSEIIVVIAEKARALSKRSIFRLYAKDRDGGVRD